jgi:hypothetical protein
LFCFVLMNPLTSIIEKFDWLIDWLIDWLNLFQCMKLFHNVNLTKIKICLRSHFKFGKYYQNVVVVKIHLIVTRSFRLEY